MELMGFLKHSETSGKQANKTTEVHKENSSESTVGKRMFLLQILKQYQKMQIRNKL